MRLIPYRIRTLKMLSILISIIILIVGIGCLFLLDNNTRRFQVFYNNDQTQIKIEYRKNISDAINFVKIFMNEYDKIIEQEVSIKFKNQLKLVQKGFVGVKIVISSFGEALLYFFPNDQNEIIIDIIDFPVQPAFTYGFIDINNPKENIDLQKVKIHVPLPDAIKQYKAESGWMKFSCEEDDGGILFVGRGSGKLILKNTHKIASMPNHTILGLINTVIFDNSSQHYIDVHGKAGRHEYNIEGLLLIISENTFDWSFNVAKKIGGNLAEMDIKDLFTNSEFFRLSLAEEQLRPKAEIIAQKKARSEKDTTFAYPLWEFKKDFLELKKDAEQIGIEISFIDELLVDTSLKNHDGILFRYYSNSKGFMLQWATMNLIFLIILAALTLIKVNGLPVLSFATQIFSNLSLNISIITLLILANGYVFTKKPEGLTIDYWVLPTLLFLSCIAWITTTINLNPKV